MNLISKIRNFWSEIGYVLPTGVNCGVDFGLTEVELPSPRLRYTAVDIHVQVSPSKAQSQPKSRPSEISLFFSFSSSSSCRSFFSFVAVWFYTVLCLLSIAIIQDIITMPLAVCTHAYRFFLLKQPLLSLPFHQT